MLHDDDDDDDRYPIKSLLGLILGGINPEYTTVATPLHNTIRTLRLRPQSGGSA